MMIRICLQFSRKEIKIITKYNCLPDGSQSGANLRSDSVNKPHHRTYSSRRKIKIITSENCHLVWSCALTLRLNPVTGLIMIIFWLLSSRKGIKFITNDTCNRDGSWSGILMRCDSASKPGHRTDYDERILATVFQKRYQDYYKPQLPPRRVLVTWSAVR